MFENQRLTLNQLKEMLEYKLLSKANYIQLCLAMRYGVMTLPKNFKAEIFLSQIQDDDESIRHSDVLAAIAKLYKLYYKNDDEEPAIQLQLNLNPENVMKDILDVDEVNKVELKVL